MNSGNKDLYHELLALEQAGPSGERYRPSAGHRIQSMATAVAVGSLVGLFSGAGFLTVDAPALAALGAANGVLAGWLAYRWAYFHPLARALDRARQREIREEMGG